MPLPLLILLYGGGPRGPFAGGVCLLFLAAVLVMRPGMIFKMKLLFDEPGSEAELEKKKSIVRIVGYIIAVLGVIVLVSEAYNYTN